MEQLPLRQQQVLTFIKDFVEKNEYPPSLRDISAHLGVTGNTTILKHLNALEKKGYLRRDSGSSRGIVLTREKQPQVMQVPIVGTVRAGSLTLAVEDIEGYYPLDKLQLKGGTFLLRVRGDSMINDAIADGDLALIRPQETADNGDIVVAMVDGEVTLKRFYKERDHIRLQPRNPNMNPIIIPAGEPVTIIGKAIRIIREIE